MHNQTEKCHRQRNRAPSEYNIEQRRGACTATILLQKSSTTIEWEQTPISVSCSVMKWHKSVWRTSLTEPELNRRPPVTPPELALADVMRTAPEDDDKLPPEVIATQPLSAVVASVPPDCVITQYVSHTVTGSTANARCKSHTPSHHLLYAQPCY